MRTPGDDRRRLLRQLALAIVALSLLVFVVQAWRAVSALRAAEEVTSSLADRIVIGDVPGARAYLKRFDEETTTAHRATNGPIWWLGAKIPYVGRNIDALRIVAAETDAVADQALPKVVDLADRVQLETFRPKNGRVDLVAVSRALPVLQVADRVMARADARIGGIDVDRLFWLIRPSVADVQKKTHDAAAATGAARAAGELMPTMLGAHGKTRRYLMLMLNNAEVRSLGGMPGSVAVVRARRGKVDMGQQGGIHDLRPLEKPALPIKPERAGGFSTTVGTDMRDTTSVPNFPRAADLAAAVVGEHWDEKYDGVVAIDPVALGYVLGGLGPVNVGEGITLTETNAVSVLLNGVYVRYPTDADRQDDVFELAARRSFDALTDGTGNSVRTIRALVRGVQERRVMLWSRDADEQRRIRQTGIAGEWSPDRRKPEVGFFVNDSGSTKMEYYLRMESRLQSVRCDADGTETLKLTSTLRSEVPVGGALPASVTGPGVFVTRGDTRLNPLILAPPGGRVVSLSVDGIRAPVGATKYRGRHVVRVSRVIPPGESSVLTVTLQTAPGAHGPAVLRTTPGVVANDDTTETRACG